ncbi:hypothetical protein AVEN_211820-1 [Araneus ventricosus]|uniref:Integrase catalytic domain-containing protein n=1 Tax=Araneus ventricosus TaxID=182803 RepID=A0A4Y2CL30_ARAVE|nr:hypothetical protein AVEN_237316-1 [Araneus ventricosus]GBM05063.1 hypothetical protein AVEN_211820-1 [Araneus ventricosus]
MVASYTKTLATGHCQTLSRCTNSRSFGIHKDLRQTTREIFLAWSISESTNYVMHYKECQRRKPIPRKPPSHLMPMPAVEAPFHRVGVDLLGRFPKSLEDNKWIIVCTDYLTLYSITKSLPSAYQKSQNLWLKKSF